MGEKKDGDGKPQDRERQQEPSPMGQTITPRQPTQPNQNQISNLEKEMSRAETGMLRWNCIVAWLTFVLACVGAFQAYSFVESERAFLVLKNIAFINGEPTEGDTGRDDVVTITNVGKHVASISELSGGSLAGVVHKTLPDVPPTLPQRRLLRQFLRMLIILSFNTTIEQLLSPEAKSKKLTSSRGLTTEAFRTGYLDVFGTTLVFHGGIPVNWASVCSSLRKRNARGVVMLS